MRFSRHKITLSNGHRSFLLLNLSFSTHLIMDWLRYVSVDNSLGGSSLKQTKNGLQAQAVNYQQESKSPVEDNFPETRMPSKEIWHILSHTEL